MKEESSICRFLALVSLGLAAPVLAHAEGISAIWAGEGGDKVAREELRASSRPSSVLSSVWDGKTIHVFGARNETVSFDLIIEAARAR
ncbi:MAG: hypothetical protein ACXWP5_15640, partial [Bdellovibrionota bacterium]